MLISSTQGSTPAPTILTTLTSSTSQPVSETTPKECEEMQAVDENVSKNIIVTPNTLSEGENIKFQPTSLQGVSFGEDNRKPRITVRFGKPARVRSVTLPRDKIADGNVEQFEVTLYSPDEKQINDKPILSSTSPKDDNSKPAEVTARQILSDRLVSYLDITIVSTTNNESPKSVVLDIQACTEIITG